MSFEILFIFLVAFTCLATVMLVKFLLELTRRRRLTSKRKRPISRHLSGVSESLKRRLYLLTGERQTALRLVNALQQRYPGKSASWYWEKAIADLERDRY